MLLVLNTLDQKSHLFDACVNDALGGKKPFWLKGLNKFIPSAFQVSMFQNFFLSSLTLAQSKLERLSLVSFILLIFTDSSIFNVMNLGNLHLYNFFTLL